MIVGRKRSNQSAECDQASGGCICNRLMSHTHAGVSAHGIAEPDAGQREDEEDPEMKDCLGVSRIEGQGQIDRSNDA